MQGKAQDGKAQAVEDSPDEMHRIAAVRRMARHSVSAKVAASNAQAAQAPVSVESCTDILSLLRHCSEFA